MSTQRQNRPAYLDGHPHLVARQLNTPNVSVSEARNEAVCTECRRRVTVNNGIEYGHARGLRGGVDTCSHHCHGGAVK